MKKQVLCMLMVFISILSFAQENTETLEESEEDSKELIEAMELMFASEIVMDIDKELDPTSQGMSHFSEDQKAGVIAMVVPASFKDLKEDLGGQESKDGSKILERGENKMGGKNTLYLKQKMEREGHVFISTVYCKETTKDSTIMITSFYEEGEENVYNAAINKAVTSAVLKINE
jgi:hypothetical protein